jgi:hypothetical protein
MRPLYQLGRRARSSSYVSVLVPPASLREGRNHMEVLAVR